MENEKTIPEQSVAPEQSTRKLPPKITKENILPPGTLKDKIFHVLTIIFYLTISSFLLSFAIHCLISPNNFAVGGISGIAILLNTATNGLIPQSVTTFCINLPLIVLSFFFVRRRFAILTAANIIMQTLWLIFLENTDLIPAIDFGEQKIFAALAGGVVIGVAIACAFKIGGSTGGVDILAVMIQRKYQASSIAWMLFTINCIVIGASFFVFKDLADTPVGKILPILMAAFEQFVESKTNESVSNGFQSVIEFRVITNKPEEIAQSIMFELGRGVTSIPAVGMYTQEEKSMLVCVISRRQIAAFKRILKTVDPDSFAILSNVSQVVGLGFFSGEI